MTNDFSPIDPSESESEGSMFAGTPSWERGKKRRGFGGRTSRVADEPRSFTAEPSDTPAAYEARMDTVDPTDTAFADPGFAGGATFADRSRRKGNGAGPILVAAGVILLGGLAAAGWYATQSHNAGVAQLTPGSTTTTTQVASTAPTADQPAAAPPAAEPAPPAAAPPARVHSAVTTTTRTPRGATSHTTVTHARPAAEAGADASATTPARPTPMPAPTQAAPPAAAPPAPLVLTIPQTQAAPAETPVTPQTAPATPPTQTPPG
jgi:hypothetical protein